MIAKRVNEALLLYGLHIGIILFYLLGVENLYKKNAHSFKTTNICKEEAEFLWVPVYFV